MQQDTVSRPYIISRSDSSVIENAGILTSRQWLPEVKTPGKSFRPTDLTLYLISDTSSRQPPLSVTDTETFPFSFITRTREYREKEYSALKEYLKEGLLKESPQLKADWMIPLLMVSAMIYIILSKIPGSLLSNLLNFLTFKGLRDKYQADAEKIFRVQSTMINLASFINISLFMMLVIKEKGIALPLTGGFLLWLACFALVILVVTFKHILTVLTGIVSEENELFSGYLSAIYSFYRIFGLLSFLFVILLAYSRIFPAGFLITTGFVFLILLILMRITRLFLLFIRRRASVLYLILYLCALEILPVAVLLKYGTGLISGL